MDRVKWFSEMLEKYERAKGSKMFALAMAGESISIT